MRPALLLRAFSIALILSACTIAQDPAWFRHGTKTLQAFRADHYDCESTVAQKAHDLSRNPATLFTDPGAGGVPWQRKEMRRCLEEKHGWRFVAE